MPDSAITEIAHRKILIVDDSRATQAILRRLVERAVDDAPTEIRLADSAVDALGLVDDYAPDLIITDWHMPRISGLEMVQTLRQLGHQRVRIGLVTAETRPERLAEAQHNGVSFVLEKPFADAALLDAVTAALRELQDAPQEEPPARSGNPTFDLPMGTLDAPRFGALAAGAPPPPEPDGPVSMEALRRLMAVAMKAVTHRLEAVPPRHFPQLSPSVLRCVFVQQGTGAEALALLDATALCLIGAGTEGRGAIAAALALTRPDAEMVHRTATVMRVLAKLIDGHGDATPWRLERAQIVARSLADPQDLLSRATERIDVALHADHLKTGYLSLLRGAS